MSGADRATYVAGVYDALVTFAASSESAETADHYQNCVIKSSNDTATNIRWHSSIRYAKGGASRETDGSNHRRLFVRCLWAA
jgi:hypothetical protein